MSDTQSNIGIRRHFTTLGARNFERSGTVQYLAAREPLQFNGTSYHVGDALPFDAGGSPKDQYSASAMAQLQLYWDQGWLTPSA